MRILKADLTSLEQTVDFLKQGGVVIHPTDTCYGMAVDITNPQAIQKIYALKKMSLQKPMSILVADFAMLEKYGKLSAKAREIAQKYLPGALTLVLPKTENVPAFYAPENDFIGLRLPRQNLSLDLVQKLGNPITTTSANLTGQVQAYTPAEVLNYFQETEVLFLDGGILPQKKPSTILKCVDDFCEIIRQGDLLIQSFEENVT